MVDVNTHVGGMTSELRSLLADVDLRVFFESQKALLHYLTIPDNFKFAMEWVEGGRSFKIRFTDIRPDNAEDVERIIFTQVLENTEQGYIIVSEDNNQYLSIY